MSEVNSATSNGAALKNIASSSAILNSATITSVTGACATATSALSSSHCNIKTVQNEIV